MAPVEERGHSQPRKLTQPAVKVTHMPRVLRRLMRAQRPSGRRRTVRTGWVRLRDTLQPTLAMPSDSVLMAVLIVLTGSGLAVLLSASYFYGDRLFDDPLRFFRRQVLWVALGTLIAAIAAAVPLRLVRRAVLPLVAVSLPLVVLTSVPGIGLWAMGAQRWIVIGGLSFQPSELAKLALVVYLAHILDRKGNLAELTYGRTMRVIVPPLLVVGLFAALVYLQNDFSTPIFLVFLAMAMLWLAGVRMGSVRRPHPGRYAACPVAAADQGTPRAAPDRVPGTDRGPGRQRLPGAGRARRTGPRRRLGVPGSGAAR